MMAERLGGFCVAKAVRLSVLDRDGVRREAPIQSQGLQMITGISGGRLLVLSQRGPNAAVVVERLDP